jgi:hypothetical protein
MGYNKSSEILRASAYGLDVEVIRAVSRQQ